MSRQRLDRLRALANDPAATDAERALAREHIAKTRSDDRLDDEQLIEVGDDLVAAMDRAMARAAGVGSSAFRGSRIRAAERRLGRNAAKAWRDSRGPELIRGQR